MRTRLSIYLMDPPDPIEAVKFRMEQQGLTQRESMKMGTIRRGTLMERGKHR
jgi:antitoxin component HigA of HigAB toxin-antitoxin module